VKRIVLLVAVFALLAAGCSNDSPTDADNSDRAESENMAPDTELQATSVDSETGVRAGVRTYEIVIENLTPATGPGSSQPFSPPVLATHQRRMNVWEKGAYASDELAQIAEDAVNGPMVDKLNSSGRVYDVVEGGGVILPGQSASFEIQSFGGSDRLSAVFMLVNTNDAFGGVDGLRLPHYGEKEYYIHAWDAGSEQNTELTTDIPGPCCGSPGEGSDTRERIHRHRGIMGVGDLDEDTWGWTGPVARLTIRRINPTYEITLTNLTPVTVPGGSQVFSPPVLSTHSWWTGIFRPGRHASDELISIAEDGDTGPMVDLLNSTRGVTSVITGDGPVFPGGSATYTIEAAHIFSRFSMAFMLVNTNDGFSGVSRFWLPLGGTITYNPHVWDAGSEQNTELASDIPGPCCGSPGQGTDEHHRIGLHPGIQGNGDLSVEDYGWDDAAVQLKIKRIK
jgi:hypothetical protein